MLCAIGYEVLETSVHRPPLEKRAELFVQVLNIETGCRTNTILRLIKCSKCDRVTEQVLFRLVLKQKL